MAKESIKKRQECIKIKETYKKIGVLGLNQPKDPKYSENGT
jgi:hypothetical protein